MKRTLHVLQVHQHNRRLHFLEARAKNFWFKFFFFFSWLILFPWIICMYLFPGSGTLGFNVWIGWLMWQFTCSTGTEKCSGNLYLWVWEQTPLVSFNLFGHSLSNLREICPLWFAVSAVGNHSNGSFRNDAGKMEHTGHFRENLRLGNQSAFAQSDLI